MKRHLILLAAGKGSRMHSSVPKQFLLLCDKPLLLYSIEAFLSALPDVFITLVLNKDGRFQWQKILKEHKVAYDINIVEGGKTRCESVKNALDSIIDDSGVVAIHDAARPFISQGLIKKAFETAEKLDNAIPGISPTDSALNISDDNPKSLKRENILLTQTPQCFHLKLIKKAYKGIENYNYSDDAAVLENSCGVIRTIKGDVSNIKITRQFDLLLAEQMLKEKLL